jgi:hypothetical protein
MNTTNGRAESPSRVVARSASELLHDLLTLAELQGQLFVVDCESGLRKLLLPGIFLVVGGVLALCCVPLAFAVLGLAIAETTTLTIAQALGCVLGGSVIFSAVLLTLAILYLRRNWKLLDHSRTELKRNLQWTKEMLSRLSRRSPPSAVWPHT